jgi:hypothetical protein
MWTLAKQAKLQSFRKKPSYILLYIVVCKICSVCCISFRYNFIAKSYPMLDVLLMQDLSVHLAFNHFVSCDFSLGISAY